MSESQAGESAAPSQDAPSSDRAPAVDSPQALFDRPAPVDYLEEWTERLAQAEDSADEQRTSLVIFRLGEEWLALRTGVLAEVTSPQPIHSVPHRSGEVLLGLVNVRGQLRIAVSLHGLLGVQTTPTVENDSTRRLLILGDRGNQWVFWADQVTGVQRVDAGLFRKVPSTFGKASSFCRAVFEWRDRTVGWLDDERIEASLRSACQ